MSRFTNQNYGNKSGRWISGSRELANAFNAAKTKVKVEAGVKQEEERARRKLNHYEPEYSNKNYVDLRFFGLLW